jgi:hypothetical protein
VWTPAGIEGLPEETFSPQKIDAALQALVVSEDVVVHLDGNGTDQDIG